LIIYSNVQLGLVLSGGSTKSIKVELEPVVDLAMDRVVLVAELPRGAAFDEGAHFGCSPVFVGARHEEDAVAL
jgi:hypothetical protein